MRYKIVPSDNKYYIEDTELEQTLGWVKSEFMAEHYQHLLNNSKQELPKSVDTVEE